VATVAAGRPLDPRALVRVLDELLWSLRREGFEISTAQAIDAARALVAVGLDNPAYVREAVACVVLQRSDQRARFDAAFARFFASDASRPRGTLWERLEARGFQPSELEALRDLLERLAAGGFDVVALTGLAERGADLDRLLVQSQVARNLDAHSGLMIGYVTHRVASEVGAGRAHGAMASLRTALVDALGERGRELAGALTEELEGAADDIRAFVKRTHDTRVSELEARRRAGGLETTPFASLTDAQIEDVRRAVRRFADRLRGAARVRARHARRGRIDPHRTLRRALRTGGIPFDVVHTRRRRDRPKILVLCDVSDSVRAAAGFLLEFTYAAQELFERARTFVFVSELGETTDLFRREPVRHAIDLAWRAVVPSGENSNYGRVLRSFEARHLRELDRSTTVVVLGDGRTNYHDAAPEVLDRIRARARALVWLCPEPRGQWSIGDSAMARYAPRCTAVLEVGCALDLERAARRLVAR
jgi:uncharacterized protein with von Willebrand factor type A (vWA) domain